ncbi:MAG: hypothetical protein ABSD49_05715 [Candidatus Bathyarchaeia archaeon]|jgi:hypothetical protein
MSSVGRPTGVAILAILEAIAAVYYLVTGFGEFIATSILRTLARSGIPSDIIPLIPRFVGAVLIIFGLVSLLLAWGLWTGKGWARMTALVFAILSIIVSLISFHLIGLVIDVVIIYYLTRPNVKQFFTK